MKQVKTLILGIAATAGVLVPLADASAWVAAGPRGVAVGGYHGGAYYHPAYHPAGCYGCGAAAGAVAGMAVGAAVASAARPTTVVVAQPVYAAPQPVYVAQGNVPIGTQYAALPSGARSMNVNGVTYYQSGPTWYKPYFGSSGVYYEVVPAP
jgi:hypothetical protein